MGKVLLSGVSKGATKPLVIDPVLANNSPETIQMAAKYGRAANCWAVGDKVPITLNGPVDVLTFNNETYYAFIIGFNHNSDIEGGNTIHFQFGKTSAGKDIAFVDSYMGDTSYNPGFRMTNKYSTSGGWESSHMRNTVCPAFKTSMPTEWQNVLVACTKYSDNTGGGSTDLASYVTATSDKIFLLSEFEVFGTRTYANSSEQTYQKQYDYYKSGNGKVKYRHNSTSNIYHWWLRSVHVGSDGTWCYVLSGGSIDRTASYASFGFAPCFVVA